MKKIVLISFLLIVIIFLNSTEITLYDCIDNSIKNSYEVNNADINMRNSRLNRDKTIYDFIPDVSVSASKWKTNYESSVLDSVDYEIERKDQNLYLQANLHLFDERVGNLLNSQRSYNIEKFNLTQQKRNTALEILKLYSDLLIQKDILDYYQNSVELYEKHLTYTRELMSVGKRTELDLYSTEIELKNVELGMSQSENTINKKLLELSQKTGMEIKDINSLQLFSIEVSENLTQQTVEENIYWQEEELYLKKEKTNRNIYLKRLLPDLYIQGTYLDYLETDTENDYDVQDYDEWTISLNISYSLGDILNKAADYRISRRKVKSQQMYLDWFKDELDRDLQSRILDLKLKKKEIEIQSQKLELAEKSFQLAEDRFRLGIINFLDFKTAHNDLLDAQIDLVKAKYAQIQAFAEWQDANDEKVFGKY